MALSKGLFPALQHRKFFWKSFNLEGPVYTVRTKLQKFLRSYVKGVHTVQNDAYQLNGLTVYSVGGHDIALNWMTEITDLLQFFVV